MKGLTALAALAAIPCFASAATIDLTGTIRDFCNPAITGTCSAHPDFETFFGDDRGIVQTTLGVDGKPVYAGLAGNPTTTGQTTFDQWFRDTPGVNASTPLTITLAEGPSGIFTYFSGSFFPIDNQLFGNQGRGHNYSFTFELHTDFTYRGGENFSFTGDDDVWVFINKSLAIDLGGVHGAESAAVALDTLGLTRGQTYGLDLFFAERHTVGSDFGFTTELVLATAVPEPGTLSLLSAGLAGLAWRRRRRR